jgi:hypothetical protein
LIFGILTLYFFPIRNCPVCDSKALYDTLLIDGYFLEVLESKELPQDENDVILERDGTWIPVPKEEEKSQQDGRGDSKNGSSGQGGAEDNVDLIDLSDDDDIPLPPGPPLPPPLPVLAPPPPPPMPAEIECIDLD